MSMHAISVLANHLSQGRAVFFVGSGFSIDPEDTGVGRLIKRLQLRLAQLEEVLRIKGDYQEDLEKKFGADKIADNYFEANSWYCAAFGQLLEQASLLSPSQRRQLSRPLTDGNETIAKIDSKLLSKTCKEPDSWRERGKALFLDTIGFCCEEVFAGKPLQESWSGAMESFPKDRIMDRHRALARWAREGWFQTLLTTNFDLLLEGALRETGLDVGRDGKEKDATKSLGHNIEQFTVVSCLENFLKRGHGNRTIRLLKIHGCLGEYRERGSYADRREYLKSIVFNYREIQHWRRDAWARDLVRGFQRTHSVAFLGYSMADPVVHATMREVYEEMRDWRGHEADEDAEAPAFYFSFGGARDFYAVEILEAADHAVGIQRDTPQAHREEHPHFLDFHTMWPKGAPDLKFPSQDESLKWVNHLAYRQLQKQALDQALEQALMDTLGEPRPKSQIESIKKQLEEITESEKEEIPKLKFQGEEAFEEITGWTWTFHPAVMRAMVCTEREWIDSVHMDLREWEGESGMLMKAYCPANDHLPWLAWSTVVELALRRAAAMRMKQPLPETNAFRENNLRFRMEAQPRGAKVSFARRDGPSECGVHLDWENKSATRGKPLKKSRRGSRLNVKQWMIARRPWRLREDEGRKRVFRAKSGKMLAPEAARIWQWSVAEIGKEDVEKWL